ncbi:hypothetical protein SLA2020_492980 [Shorea laevis]
MESLSVLRSCSPPFRSPSKTPKFSFSSFKLIPLLPNSISTHQVPNSRRTHFPSTKITSSPSSSSRTKRQLQNPLLHLNCSRFLQTAKSHLCFTLFDLFASFPSLASETIVSSTEPVSDKINLEAILVSIDDFFNRYPFFVAGCTFIWLIVLPLTQEYLSKCKFISAIDAFSKLREDPNAQLLDIRDAGTLTSLPSPNLKILSKGVVQIQFSEGDEDGFVRKVLENFPDPANTVLCLLDNFDRNSLRAAELLFKSGFKEAYAIRGGVRGKKGWVSIQGTLLPSSVHIKPKKKKKKKVDISKDLGVNGGLNPGTKDNKEDSSSTSISIGDSQKMGVEHEDKSMKLTPDLKIGLHSSSPYPNYPDLKPPSSPTPSKP